MDDEMMPMMPPMPRPDHVSASKMSEPPMPEEPEQVGGDLESVRIRPASNGGYIVSCERRPEPQKGVGPLSYSPPKEYAFTSTEELFTFLKGELA